MKRQEYLANSEQNHRPYYGQFVDDSIKALVVNLIGLEAIRASTDRALNDIPLKQWDNIVESYLMPNRELRQAFKEAGTTFALSDGVCLLKEAARQLKESI